MKILAISIPVCGKYNAIDNPSKNESGLILGMASSGCDTVSFKRKKHRYSKANEPVKTSKKQGSSQANAMAKTQANLPNRSPVNVGNLSLAEVRALAIAAFGLDSKTKSEVQSQNKIRPVSRKVVQYKDIRDIPGLTCACCGIKMIPNNVYNDFINNVLYYPARYSLSVIEKSLDLNSANTPSARIESFCFLKDSAELYPQKNIIQLINVSKVNEKYTHMSEKMQEEVQFIVKTAREVSRPISYVMEEITKLRPHLHENERQIYNELYELSSDFPNLSIQEILNRPEVKEHYLSNLIEKQNAVLKQVSNISKTMSMESQAKIALLVKDAGDKFEEESAYVMQKRSRVVNSFYVAAKDIPETKAMLKIIKTMEALPSSKDDIDAFMVKYAKRSSNETIEVLLGRSRSTFEHIKPNNRIGDRGTRDKSNGICLCSKCNGERQQTPYSEFVLKHPQMLENTQKQIDMIIDFINKGLLTGYDKYPEGVKRSLDTESDSAIAINTDKLMSCGKSR